jgi:hypothetical protein
MDNKGINLFIICFALFLFFILCMDKPRDPDPIYSPTTKRATTCHNPRTNHKITEKFMPSSSKTKEPESPYVFDDDDDYDNPDYDVEDLDELENY